MLEFSEKAREEILAALEGEEEKENTFLRVKVNPGMPGPHRHTMMFVPGDEKTDADEEFDAGGFRYIVDAESRKELEGARVDFVVSPSGPGFKIEPPKPDINDPRAPSVQKLLEEKINPGIAMHGGFVELIDVKENRVYVRLGGGCQGCGMVDVTLKHGIESMIREEIPSITEVLDVTDHASGTNPYYQPGK
jgi:Fe/S biogenesis protein NfuA